MSNLGHTTAAFILHKFDCNSIENKSQYNSIINTLIRLNFIYLSLTNDGKYSQIEL